MKESTPMKSRGLGDTIAKITAATGIKKVVEAVSEATGKDCGCDKRKDTLNRMFPYNKNK
jgi:glycerol dehydrogenase-like iron-containing ADH family enzyme